MNDPLARITDDELQHFDVTAALTVRLQERQQALDQKAEAAVDELRRRNFPGTRMDRLYLRTVDLPKKHFWSKRKRQVIYQDVVLWELPSAFLFLADTGQIVDTCYERVDDGWPFYCKAVNMLEGGNVGHIETCSSAIDQLLEESAP